MKTVISQIFYLKSTTNLNYLFTHNSLRHYPISKRYYNHLHNDTKEVFLKNIPIKYDFNSKNKPVLISFAFAELKEQFVVDKIINRLEMDCVYTVFIKVRYNVESFYMLGNQFGFILDNTDKIKDLYHVLMYRLDMYMESYDLIDDNIVYIEMSFRKKDKTLLSEFIKDNMVNPVETRDSSTISNVTNIPISVNETSLGNPLTTHVTNGFITDIELTIDNNTTNFFEIIKEKSGYIRNNHVDSITCFDSGYKFYLVRDDNKVLYVLAVKIIDGSSIDKIRYSISGTLINRVKDVFSDGLIHRISGEKVFTLKDGKIILLEQSIKLKAMLINWNFVGYN